MITLKHGNIFNTKAGTIVNTVNCVGVMGAGIAYEFRLRYPEMFSRYVELCSEYNPNKIDIGKLWLYKASDGRQVLNFPTKKHWRDPSKMSYIKAGLEKFANTYASKNIDSVAFPLLGAANGGLNKDEVINLMMKFLEPLNIECEIWEFDENASDDLYDDFALNFDINELKRQTKALGVKNIRFQAIKDAIDSGLYHSLSSLLKAPGIGDKSLEACFRLVKSMPQRLF